MDGTLPNSFYEATVTLLSKPDKNITKKLKANIFDDYDAKILNKILAKKIQQYIKMMIHQDQVGSIPRTQGWFNICKSNSETHINKRKEKKTHDNLNRQRKSI